MVDIPHTFPTASADRILASWQEIGLGEMLIQLEMEFSHALDVERLARAASLLLDAQPVLGCRLVLRPGKPYWERVETDAHAHVREVDAAAYEAQKNAAFDMQDGPQIKLCVQHRPDGDKVLLRVSHLAADSGGVKETASDLAMIYTRLASDPAFRPAPNVSGSRSFWQVMKRLPWWVYADIPFRLMRAIRIGMFPQASHNLRYGDGPRTPLDFAVRHIPKERTSFLAQYGRERGATLNDMMLAAANRALVAQRSWDGSTGLRFQTTADMRRWFIPGGRAAGICNVSGFEYPYLVDRLGGSFDETLALVSGIMRRMKRRGPGLVSVYTMPLMSWMSFDRLVKTMIFIFGNKKFVEDFPPALTNMGPIQPSDVNFDRPARRAWLLTPSMYPPITGAGLSGYDGSITLSAGGPPATMAVIGPFFDQMLAELPDEPGTPRAAAAVMPRA